MLLFEILRGRRPIHASTWIYVKHSHAKALNISKVDSSTWQPIGFVWVYIRNIKICCWWWSLFAGNAMVPRIPIEYKKKSLWWIHLLAGLSSRWKDRHCSCDFRPIKIETLKRNMRVHCFTFSKGHIGCVTEPSSSNRQGEIRTEFCWSWKPDSGVMAECMCVCVRVRQVQTQNQMVQCGGVMTHGLDQRNV